MSQQNVKIKTGGHEVLYSGCCITFDNKNLELQFGELIFEFAFTSTPDGKSDLSATTRGKRTILNLVNFNTPLGTGTKAPLEIGEIEDRKFYLSFYVTAANADNSKQVMYTFYLGERHNE